MVVAEEASLRKQVIGSLISNSIKFSYPGAKIWIKLSIRDKYFIFIMEDNGIGMPLEIMAKLFSSSSESSRQGTSGETGTGFGMPLVKKYIESYGGSIDVNSTEAGEDDSRSGSQFVVKLKLAPKE